MTRIYALICALALTGLILAGCSPYQQCVKPVTSQITWSGTLTELGEVVGAFLACDPTFNGGEAPDCALTALESLASSLGVDGTQIVNCLVAYYLGKGTPVQQATARAVAVKRGIRASDERCGGSLAGTRERGLKAGSLVQYREPPLAKYSEQADRRLDSGEARITCYATNPPSCVAER